MSANQTDSPAGSSSRLGFAAALGLCAIAAAVSLIPLGQETGNDANSWLVWAGQLAQGHSINFSVGPSWKPLPVLLSLPFEFLSGQLAAHLWLWFVRFCLLATSLLLFKLTRREWGLLGGAVAALLPFAIGPWLTAGIAGMSEPVLIAASLAAITAGTSGRPRLALGFAIAAGLVRPEVWIFVLFWLTWRMLKDGEPFRTVAREGLGALSIWFVLWFVLPVSAGAKALQASDRASEFMDLGANGSAIFGVWLRVVPQKAWILIPVGLLAGAVLRHQRRGRFALLAAAAAAVWLVETLALNLVGVEPGISRYAIPAGIALCALAGAGAGWLLELTEASATRELVLRTSVTFAVGLLAGWALIGSAKSTRTSWDNAIAFQASSDSELAALNKAGGLKALNGCLPFATAGYPSHARILARRVNRPLQTFSAIPEDAHRGIVLTSNNPGVRAIPQMPSGTGVPLSTSGPWTVTYFGPRSGCTPN
ncbi:MAG: hypothetical protein NTX07_06845 [Solirubrobacterales bacterium]|nr:hypothetical protein [Solirubrobacterales bacterium]